MSQSPHRSRHFYLSDLLTFFLLAGLPAALGAGGAMDADVTYFVLNVVACPAIMWWSVSCLNAFEILPAWKRSLFHVYAWVAWISVVGTPMLLTAAVSVALCANPWTWLLVIADLAFVGSFVYLNHLRKARLGLAVSPLRTYCIRCAALLATIVCLLCLMLYGGPGVHVGPTTAFHMRALLSAMGRYESSNPGFVLDIPKAQGNSENPDLYWFSRKRIRLGRMEDAWGRPLIVRPLDGEPVDKKDPRLVCFGKRWLLIYSAGRNGKDEDGRGDDIPINEE